MTTFGVWLGDREFALSMRKDGETVPVCTDAAHQTYPFLVSFSKSGITFANRAHNSIKKNYETTVTGLRQLIGRIYNDVYVTDLKERIYYEITAISELPFMPVSANNQLYNYSAESVLAILFYQVKYMLEKRSKEKVMDLTITVPHYYTRRQMINVKRCAEVVGIKKVSVQYEAEMFACYLYSFYHEEMKFGYFSLSNDEFVISEISIKEEIENGKKVPRIKTIQTASKLPKNKPRELLFYDLVDFLSDEGKDIKGDHGKEVMLRSIIDETVLNLRNSKEVEFDLSQFCPGLKKSYKESDLEDLLDVLIDEIIDFISNTSFGSFDYMVFMGELPNFPFLIEHIKENFEGELRVIDIPNMQPSCALGAALFGSGSFTIVPTLHHNIVIPGKKAHSVYNIVEKHKELPAIGEHKLSASQKGEIDMKISIYEGDSKKRKNYSKIGSFSFTHKFNESNKRFVFGMNVNKGGEILCFAKGNGYEYKGKMTDVISFSLNDVIKTLNHSKIIIELANEIEEDISKLIDYCDEYKGIIQNSEEKPEEKKNALNQVNEIEKWCKEIIESFPTEKVREEIKGKTSELEMIDITKFIKLELH